MNLSLPVYIEERKVAGEPRPVFVLRPLFFEAPRATGRQLSAGLSKLAQLVRNHLDAIANAPRQDDLVPWTFAPPLIERSVSFTLRLRRQTADARFLVVSFEALGRRLAFTPALPDLFFELLRGQDVAARAEEVLTDHYRRLEKDEGDDFALPEVLTAYARAWVTTLELDIHPNPTLKPPVETSLMAIFGGGTKPDGRIELAKVGRCLDWLYPDELDRVVLRDAEAAELTRLLAARDRRPVLILGPRKVGKTALVHEAVFRRVAARASAHTSERNTWLLSGPRLISGMSYVGQWESRLIAICQHAAKRDHVLYFDDVLGLYNAGQSADSDLSVAAVMRPIVERREFRLLAEMTPDAFRVLREKDRGLADLFHVLPLDEPAEPQARRVLMHVIRNLEDRHRCRFDPAALPAAMDLQRRYVRDQSMPGKAAAFLSQLASKYAGASRQGGGAADAIDRRTVMAEFQSRSGLSVAFLDHGARLDRATVVNALAKDIVGQNEALSAMADVVAIGKARLNDPGRPLGTFLFLGPTGVGKTAAAKALAAYLYGDASRLVRFDLNEYVDASSPARLTGTFANPEGLLTSAIRRQPYCVLLLDEIEKAHPGVFDLLLQVLGEGRLTDALGRTSDFGSAVVIMTSNLGSREAGQSFGLRPAAHEPPSRREAYTDAARNFFRPEFFNRIDRIVPFASLARDQIAAIADRLIADLFRREGLVHRRCVLDIEPPAMNRIVDQGYHPDLGARALKRAVERQLTAPIAQRLAMLPPDAPTIVSIRAADDGGIVPTVRSLENARPIPPRFTPEELSDPDEILDRVEDFLDRVEARDATDGRPPIAGSPVRPLSGSIPPNRVSADALNDRDFRHFAIREQVARVDRRVGFIDDELDRTRKKSPANKRRPGGPRVPPVRRIHAIADTPEQLAAILAETRGDPLARLGEFLESARPLGDELADRLTALAHECALLGAMQDDRAGGRARVTLRPTGGGGGADHEARMAPVRALRDAYATLFPKQAGLVATVLPPAAGDGALAVDLEMPGIAVILRGETGVHLFHPPGEGVMPVSVTVSELPIETGGNSSDTRSTRVLRLYDPAVATLDLRTGLLCPKLPTGDDLKRMILATLPMPEGF
jgi:ATP-dependent Clp protease ATP-binding subunit ClpA